MDPVRPDGPSAATPNAAAPNPEPDLSLPEVNEAEGEPLEVVELVGNWCGGGGHFPRDQRNFEVIQDEESFRTALVESLWNYMPDRETHPLPEVDFAEYDVIGVYAGNIGCREFRVAAVRDVGDEVEVEVRTWHRCFVSGLESTPVSFARVPRLGKPYVFVETEEREEECWF